MLRASGVAAAITSGLALGRLFLSPNETVALVLALTALGFLVASAQMQWAPESTIGPFLLPTVGMFGTLSMAAVEGGLASEATMWFPFVPIVAYITLGDRAHWAFGAWMALGATLLLLVDTKLPLSSPVALEVRVLRLLSVMGTLAFAIVLVHVYEGVRHSANSNLAAQRRLLRSLVTNLRAGVAITDEHANLITINQGLCDVFGLIGKPIDLQGRNTWEVISGGRNQPADVTTFGKRIVELAKGRQACSEEIEMADGRIFARDFLPITLTDGAPAHLWCYHDVTAHTDHRAEITQALHIDPVSGVSSRIYFDKALVLACQQRRAFALLFIDLDHFKTINDTHGHEFGDQVLSVVGDRLQTITRENDVVARLGGDEFGVIASGVHDEEQARVIADKVVRVLNAAGDFAKEVRISASVGVAIFPLHGTDPVELLRVADAAMYDSKRRGRDRFSLPPSQSPSSTPDAAE